ncbi:MAG: HAD family hydrolase [Lachnospiraceae bacterium]|nr:HAD family hydrolase [Lachnospiraceae bacterium]
MKYEALLFDLDGTLWNATDNIINAWIDALSGFDELKDFKLTPEALHSVLGKPMDEIADILFPELEENVKLRVLERCCEVENDYLNEHGGILYPGLTETLDKLSEKIKLFIVSNGQTGYIQTFLNSHNMWKYFTDIQNWGDNKVPKGENIKLVIERNNIKNAAYVGDTQGDADAAKLAGIDFIFASYGFGNVKEYDYVIDGISDVLKFI